MDRFYTRTRIESLLRGYRDINEGCLPEDIKEWLRLHGNQRHTPPNLPKFATCLQADLDRAILSLRTWDGAALVCHYCLNWSDQEVARMFRAKEFTIKRHRIRALYHMVQFLRGKEKMAQNFLNSTLE